MPAVRTVRPKGCSRLRERALPRQDGRGIVVNHCMSDAELVATLMDIGPREVQQDRAVAHCHDDGSWVVAVFDGLGGHDRGAEAAEAAAEAFPARINGSAEMHSAVSAANAAVWGLVPNDKHVPRVMGFHRRWPARFEPLTTVAAASWSPEGGLQTAWMGDSVLFFVPLQTDVPGMHSEPQGSWDSPLMDNALGFTSEPDHASVGSMHSTDITMLNGHIENDGLLVVAATDGLFDPIRIGRHGRGGRFFTGSPDSGIGFAIPAGKRSNAHDVAESLMDAARGKGLTDNAAVAVSLARR